MSDHADASTSWRSRRLLILELCILFVSLGLGCYGASRWKVAPNAGLWIHAQRVWVVLTSLSLALLLIRKCDPPQQRAAGTLGAGDAACLGVLVGVLLIFASRLPGMAIYWWKSGRLLPDYFQTMFDDRRPAIAVLTAWVILKLTKTRAPSRDWIDRAGVIAGGTWVALAIVVPVANTLWTMR